MGKRTKIYNRIQELYDNLWDGIKNVSNVLDYKYITKTLDYITTGTANILYTLNDSVSVDNMLVRIECFNEQTPYYTLCIYKTNESDLTKVYPVPVNDFGAYYDRILSMRIFNDYTKIVYSDGLKAEDIHENILKLEQMVYNYLKEHHCSELEQINAREEVNKLEEMS